MAFNFFNIFRNKSLASINEDATYKFGVLKGKGKDEIFQYPQIWIREKIASGDRLVIAPRGNHVDLMLKLAQSWSGPYFILYVLVVPRGEGQEAGRYQSPNSVNYSELEQFFLKYKQVFETDGRHHVWIASASNEGTLVYDQHNVIYAYGMLDKYESILTEQGFTSRQVKFPAPHTHHYHAENDIKINELLNHWEWVKSPLAENDEY